MKIEIAARIKQKLAINIMNTYVYKNNKKACLSKLNQLPFKNKGFL